MKRKALSLFSIILFCISLNYCESIQNNTNEFQNYSKLSVDRSTWFFTPLELVSTVSDASSYLGDFQIDDSDNIHVAWKDFTDYDGAGSDADIFYRKWSKDTSQWSSTVVISTDSTDYSDRASLAIDMEGNVHITWDDENEYLGSDSDLDVFYRKWNVQTSTWSAIELVSSESSGHSFSSSLAIDSSNNLHIVWNDMSDILSAGVDRDIFYKMKFHENNTWTTTQVLSTSGSDDSHYPVIHIDNLDNCHVAWYDGSDVLGAGSDNDIFYRKWNSNQETWEPITVISSVSDSGSSNQEICSDENGNVFIAWDDFSDYSGSGSDADVFVRKWDPYMGLWTETYVVSTGMDSHSYSTTIDVDDYGWIHFAWYQAAGYGGSGYDRDIYYKSWDPNDNNWSGVYLVSRGSNDDSWEPLLRVDSIGHLFFSWYDETTDLLDSGSDCDIFMTKFVGAPEAPDLKPISPNPTEARSIDLEWNNVIGATIYLIYRSNSEVDSYEDMIPVESQVSTNFTDSVNKSGLYYYAVVAENEYGKSSFSNTESVQVIDPSKGIFQNFSFGEILVLAGIIGGVQLIVSTAMILLVRGNFTDQKSTKKKKK